ncbi:Cyclic di-GMP phosphodiesterase Gmr [Exiguobacterium aurantiacum]|uniref:Cyclic di-GMP phosphodiesterase Gmr n=1 Tax=Exiguobacterium aurantiacum TaxID=33987 RepID=A0A377FWD3_9BACL|nr:EAL domain-containing protein [Exiguobacterium aurantiacum]STO09121.1 Cyclic di-GMP phosphodiesterase Gmr [Exiguobacterium aurantiacum]
MSSHSLRQSVPALLVGTFALGLLLIVFSPYGLRETSLFIYFMTITLIATAISGYAVYRHQGMRRYIHLLISAGNLCFIAYLVVHRYYTTVPGDMMMFIQNFFYLIMALIVITQSIEIRTLKLRTFDVFALLSFLLIGALHIFFYSARGEQYVASLNGFEEQMVLVSLYMALGFLYLNRIVTSGQTFRVMLLIGILGFTTASIMNQLNGFAGVGHDLVHLLQVSSIFLISVSFLFDEAAEDVLAHDSVFDYVIYSSVVMLFMLASDRLLGTSVLDSMIANAVLLLLIRQFVVAKQNALISQRLHTVNTDLEVAVTTKAHELEIREQQYRSLFAYHAEPIFLFDLHGEVLSVNEAGSSVLGHDAEMLIGSNILDIIEQKDRAAYATVLHDLTTGRPETLEVDVMTDDGTKRVWQLMNIPMIIDGEVEGIYAIVKDVTQMIAQQEQILYQANHDSLTGLHNRYALQEQIERLIEDGRPFTLMFSDLDGFKEINDQFGHHMGDQLLQHIGKRLRSALLPNEYAGRLGGDEFIVVAEHGDDEILIERLRRLVYRPPYFMAGTLVEIHASIGIVRYPEHGSTLKHLLSNADLAMYKAKEKGRDETVLFAPELREDKEERKLLMEGLDTALEKGEISLYLQPQVDASTKAIIGAEALMRWKRDGKFIPPSEFIPIAEETGHIQDLGRWMIHETFQLMYAFEQGEIDLPKLSVNLSVRQLFDEHLIEYLTTLFDRFPIEPSRLNFELTETVAAHHSERVLNRILELKALGIKLSIDDFGTGYSSLAYLVRYPIDELKIPREFTMQLEENREYQTVTATIVAMARQLGMALVAEGVETEYQETFLRRIGCDSMQGYRYAKPMPLDEFVIFYMKQRQ